LLNHPSNTRTFETLDGLLVVTALFKSRSTAREVKTKLVEFLYFYLMPENSRVLPHPTINASNAGVLGGRGKELVAAFERNRRESVGGVERSNIDKTRGAEEKQKLLGQYLGNVQDLVEDLRGGAGPFTAGAF
jgi:hypothetical protein